MGDYKLNDKISASKAQVLYIYGEKELNGIKESARLFQQLHPNTILYEAKGYNHGYLSAYLPQEWIKLVVPFLENNDWLYFINLESRVSWKSKNIVPSIP